MRLTAATVFAACLTVSVPAAGQIVSDRDRQEALRHYRAGEQALQQEAFERAETSFQEAVKLDPLLDIAHYGLGQVYMSTRRYTQAMHAYQRAREAYLTGYGDAMSNEVARQQRIRDQITTLEDAKRGFEAGIARSNNAFATIQRLQMQINELRIQLQRKSDQAPQVPGWISLALGSAYFRTNAMPDAEREYRAALAADPKLGEAHNNLAVVLMLTGRYDEAGREVKAAEDAGFQVNPQFKEDLKKAAAAPAR